MGEIRRFRTRTSDLKWTHPDTGRPGAHGGYGSGQFHNELKDIIDNSSSLDEFNNGVQQLLDRWQIDPSLLPDLPTNRISFKDRIFQDWVDFCEGKADFDTGDFLTLFTEDFDEQELNAALSYFPNSGQIAQRIHAVRAVYPVNRSTWIVDPEMAIQIAVDDLSERRKAIERLQDDELLSVIEKAKPRFVSDERIFKEARLSEWNGELVSLVGDYADEYWLDYTKQYYALFEAFYGTASSYEIQWYLGQPLMKTDLNFGRYFDLWKVGGDYALTEDELVVYQRPPNNT